LVETARTDAGDSIVEHVAGIDDFEVAEATYWAAVTRWPAARITLRQGARVMHESGQRAIRKSKTPSQEGGSGVLQNQTMRRHISASPRKRTTFRLG
jgi:hypothetical protein